MLSLLIIVCLIGAIAWAATTYIPMPEGIKRIIIAVAVIFAIIIVLRAMGIGGDVAVPQVG